MFNVTRRFLAPHAHNALMVQSCSEVYKNMSVGDLNFHKRWKGLFIDDCKARILNCSTSISKLEVSYKKEKRFLQAKMQENRRDLMHAQRELYQVKEALTQTVEFHKKEILSRRQLKILSDSQLKFAREKISSKIEKLKLVNDYNPFFDAEKAAFRDKIEELESTLSDLEEEGFRRALMKREREGRCLMEKKLVTPIEMKEESSTFRRLAGIVFVSSLAYMTFMNSQAKNPDVNNPLKLERMPCSSNQQVDSVKTQSTMVNNQARRILEDLQKESIAIYAQADVAGESGKSSALIAARVRSEMEMSLRKALRQLEASQLSKQS